MSLNGLEAQRVVEVFGQVARRVVLVRRGGHQSIDHDVAKAVFDGVGKVEVELRRRAPPIRPQAGGTGRRAGWRAGGLELGAGRRGEREVRGGGAVGVAGGAGVRDGACQQAQQLVVLSGCMYMFWASH